MRKLFLGLGVAVAFALALSVNVRYGDLRINVAGKTMRHWVVVDVVGKTCAFGDTGGFPCGAGFGTGGGGGTGGNTATFVQGVLGTPVGALGATSTTATGSAVGTGNTVIGAVMYTGNNFSLNTITDDKSNNYTVVETQVNTGSQEAFTCFYLTNITNAPTTITVSFNSTEDFIRLTWDEYKNVVALDAHVSNPQSAPGSGADALTSTNLTPTATGDLLWTAVDAQQGNASTLGAGEQFAAGSGETLRTQSAVGNDEALSSADKILATTNPVAGTFTAANGSGAYATCAMAMTHN